MSGGFGALICASDRSAEKDDGYKSNQSRQKRPHWSTRKHGTECHASMMTAAGPVAKRLSENSLGRDKAG